MTGWTWEQVRQEMTIPRLRAMQKVWAKQPPTHILVAGYLGYKAKDADGQAPARASKWDEKPQDLSELIEVFGAAGGNIKHG